MEWDYPAQARDRHRHTRLRPNGARVNPQWACGRDSLVHLFLSAVPEGLLMHLRCRRVIALLA